MALAQKVAIQRASAVTGIEASTATTRAARLEHTAFGNANLALLHRTSQVVQRACCSGCAGEGPCDDDLRTVMRSPMDYRPIDGRVPDAGARSSPLDNQARAHMEAAFGSDFSSVRIHHDAQAAGAAASLRAKAFTIGSDIYFGKGYYTPQSTAGRRLLAHELTHTLQQRGSNNIGAAKYINVSNPADPFEREADAVAERVASGLPLTNVLASPAISVVQCDFLDDVASDVTSAYTDASSAASDVAGAVSSEVGSTVAAISSAASKAASAVVSVVSDVASTASNVAGQVYEAAVDTGKAAVTAISETGSDAKAALLKSRYDALVQQLQAAGGDVKPSEEQRQSLNAQTSNLNASFTLTAPPLPDINVGEGIGNLVKFLGGLLADLSLSEVLIIIVIIALLASIIAKNADKSQTGDDKEKGKDKDGNDKEATDEKEFDEDEQKKALGVSCPDRGPLMIAALGAENSVATVAMIAKLAPLFFKFKQTQYELRNPGRRYCDDSIRLAADRSQFFELHRRNAQVCVLHVCGGPSSEVSPAGVVLAHMPGFKIINPEPGAVHAELLALEFIQAQLALSSPEDRTGATLFSVCWDHPCNKNADSCSPALQNFVTSNLILGDLKTDNVRDNNFIGSLCDSHFDDVVASQCG